MELEEIIIIHGKQRAILDSSKIIINAINCLVNLCKNIIRISFCKLTSQNIPKGENNASQECQKYKSMITIVVVIIEALSPYLRSAL